jgi:hypothetical protein
MKKTIQFRSSVAGGHDVAVEAETRHAAEDVILREGGNVRSVRKTDTGWRSYGVIPGNDMITSERLERNGWVWVISR